MKNLSFAVAITTLLIWIVIFSFVAVSIQVYETVSRTLLLLFVATLVAATVSALNSDSRMQTSFFVLKVLLAIGIESFAKNYFRTNPNEDMSSIVSSIAVFLIFNASLALSCINANDDTIEKIPLWHTFSLTLCWTCFMFSTVNWSQDWSHCVNLGISTVLGLVSLVANWQVFETLFSRVTLKIVKISAILLGVAKFVMFVFFEPVNVSSAAYTTTFVFAALVTFALAREIVNDFMLSAQE